MSIQPTVQSSSTTSAESQLESIKINKEEKQTKGQSSFLILDCWPGNDGVNPQQTKAINRFVAQLLSFPQNSYFDTIYYTVEPWKLGKKGYVKEAIVMIRGGNEFP